MTPDRDENGEFSIRIDPKLIEELQDAIRSWHEYSEDMIRQLPEFVKQINDDWKSQQAVLREQFVQLFSNLGPSFEPPPLFLFDDEDDNDDGTDNNNNEPR